LACGIMALRRIPAILVLYRWIPEIESWRQALFSGHFGPMGVGAVFISTLALHKLPTPSNPPQSQQDILSLAIPPIVSFVVLSSIIIHGLSIPFFNIGRGVSRTLSLTKTLTIHSKTNPDWPTHIKMSRITPLFKEGTVQEPNVTCNKAATEAATSKVPQTDTLSQEQPYTDQESKPVCDVNNPILEEIIVDSRQR